MTLFNVLDIIGTIAFAISGALTAIKRQLDLFGIFIIAFVTALGGGMLRDVLVGNTPVWWLEHSYVLYYVGIATVIAIVFRNKIEYLARGLFLFDTIGLGIFTIIGVEIGMQANLTVLSSVVLGTMTGCFGGVIRDILCNEIPVIFRKEIYATASLAGGGCFVLLHHLGVEKNVTYISTVALVIAIRLIVVKYKVALPAFTIRDKED